VAGVAYWPVSVTEGSPSDTFVICYCIEKRSRIDPILPRSHLFCVIRITRLSLDVSIQCRYKKIHNSILM